MAHTIREKTKLLNRVRRLRGQVEAIERALEEEHGCAKVLQLVASVRGAISGLITEVIDDHVENHVVAASLTHEQRSEGANELMDVVRSYLK
jgi:DNA-binding FrmR family transcriptional regulator